MHVCQRDKSCHISPPPNTGQMCWLTYVSAGCIMGCLDTWIDVISRCPWESFWEKRERKLMGTLTKVDLLNVSWPEQSQEWRGEE